MTAVTSDFESGEGREVLVDLARAAAGANGSYANFVLGATDGRHDLGPPLDVLRDDRVAQATGRTEAQLRSLRPSS